MGKAAALFAGVALAATGVVSGQPLDQVLGGCGAAAPARTLRANPSSYRSLVAGLQPGDRLLLAAGTYTEGLNLQGKNGRRKRCIVVEGPASGAPAVFLGSDSFNTVSLRNSSYLVVRNLTLDGRGRLGDGVKAESGGTAHHVTLERLKIRRHNHDLQTVGISTKCPAWNWVIRYNTITTTGTGIYLGGSSGEYEVASSLVEHNLIHRTLGYNLQIKHQLSRNVALGVPATATTIIRHNVFSKELGSLSGDDARPNVLVGHWPLSGPGSADLYQIYGNLFYQNPHEALFQGEGHIALHDNLFVNRVGPAAVRMQRHNSVPRRIEVYNNTVVAQGGGIGISGADPAYPQRVIGNAVFAAVPLVGGQQTANVTGPYASAADFMNRPVAPLGAGLDLYPKPGRLTGSPLDLAFLSSLVDWDRDFNGLARLLAYRGAYSGDGVNPGWTPALAIKP